MTENNEEFNEPEPNSEEPQEETLESENSEEKERTHVEKTEEEVPQPSESSEIEEESEETPTEPSFDGKIQIQESEKEEDVGVAESEEQVSEKKVTEEDWEEHLAIDKKKEKELKKELKKKRRAEKKKELEEMTQELLNKEFSNIFAPGLQAYLWLFLIVTAVIGILTLLPAETAELQLDYQWWQVTLTYSMIIGYLLVLGLSRVDKIKPYLFDEKKVGLQILFAVLSIAVGFGLMILYWYYTDSMETGSIFRLGDAGEQINIDALRYQQLFATILMVIYFGWNAIQIWFIKDGIQGVSIQAEAAFQASTDELPDKSIQRRSRVINVLLLLIPILLHILGTYLFVYLDTPECWEWWWRVTDNMEEIPDWILSVIDSSTGKFTDENIFFTQYLANEGIEFWALSFGDQFTTFWQEIFNYFREVWWASRPLQAIFVWFVGVFVLVIVTTVFQNKLVKSSEENETPNIFSSAFYVLFWVVLWLKFFSTIKKVVSLDDAVALTTFDIVFDYVVDFLLMLITIFMVIRSFGMRLEELDKPWINEKNSALLVFIFAISYFGGQNSLITGGVVQNIDQLTLTTNVVVIVVYTTFYFWYSKWVLQRKGFMRKMNFTLYEAKDMFVDLSQRIKQNMLPTIENEEIIKATLNEFLLENKIALKDTKDEKDGIVGDLEEEAEELSTEERVKQAKLAHEDALKPTRAYEAAVDELEGLKAEKSAMEQKLKDITRQIESTPADLQENHAKAKDRRAELAKEIQEKNQMVQNLQDSKSQLKKPSPLKSLSPGASLDAQEKFKEKQEVYREAVNDYESRTKELSEKISEAEQEMQQLIG